MQLRLGNTRPTLILTTLLISSGLAHAQDFLDNSTDIPITGPANNSQSENVDFADVDDDGDWDAVFADGGDDHQDQNRIWMNQGPGANLGSFVDETTTRLPAVNDQSRDVEFVDFDGNGTLDLYVADVSSIVNQPSRWWRNTGGGFYVDETSSRWVGLGGPGSSISPTQVFANGGFITYCGDGDFGDLDNDGDMDLFHSSYGGVFGGQTPSRIFLNDGAGYFTEFNPSGFQLTNATIANGDPGIWCEGTQQADTTNSNGTTCDVASSANDIDLGDIDGDFDLDVLHGARSELPRMFENRLEENGGTLGFRDVTGSAFMPGYSTGNGHYEQEMGDLDGDGDLDILGVNWLSSAGFNEALLENDGSGAFINRGMLLGSNADDEEGDFLDYDNDGDLDIYIANWSGQDRLYENLGSGFSFSFTTMPASTSGIDKDADACDVDGDGDYDVFTAVGNNGRNVYLENVTEVADTHGPQIPNLEQAPNRNSGPAPTVIRAQVYDNAPYYITWYNATTLNYTVDGGTPQTVTMKSSGGQIFRGEIPGILTGTVVYWVTSMDEYGNSGTSASLTYNSGNAGPVGLAFCFGDGTGAACPCSNLGSPGTGCANGTGNGGLLTGSGTDSVSNGDLVLFGSGLALNTPGVYFEGQALAGGVFGIPFGDGLRCAGGHLIRIQPRVASGTGSSNTTVNIPLKTGVAPGQTRYYQLMYRDTAGTPCGSGFNVTQALQITWTP